MQDPKAFDFDGDYGEIYEDLASRVIPGYPTLFPATLALLQERLGEKAARVMIVGTGTGREISVFAPFSPSWQFTALDPSIEMIHLSQQVASGLGVENLIEFFHGYVNDYPAGAVFDAATVLNVMHFLKDDGGKDQLMRSVADRVRPGGTVVLFDLHGDQEASYFDLFYRSWSRYMSLRGYPEKDKVSLFDRLERGICFVSESRILEICNNAGLRLVQKYWAGILYGGWLLEKP